MDAQNLAARAGRSRAQHWKPPTDAWLRFVATRCQGLNRLWSPLTP